MSKKCLKCGYEMKPTDVAPEYECPGCGAIKALEKFKAKWIREFIMMLLGISVSYWFFFILFKLHIVGIIFIGLSIIALFSTYMDYKKELDMLSGMNPDEQSNYLRIKQLSLEEANRNKAIGTINAAMVCPHCQVIGKVRIKQITVKKGISGGKVAAAVATSGVSLLVTGLSRKENSTQAHCDNCNNNWYF